MGACLAEAAQALPGLASVVVRRSHVMRAAPQFQILQNWAAAALFGRAVAAHHRLPVAPSDVVLLTRPDLLFSRPLLFEPLHAATSYSFGGLLLMARGRAANGTEARDNRPAHNDPTDVAVSLRLRLT